MDVGDLEWTGSNQIFGVGFGSVLDRVLRSTVLRCVALLYESGLPGVIALWNGGFGSVLRHVVGLGILGWVSPVAWIPSIVLRLIAFCT